MRAKVKTEGFSLITSRSRIKDIEAHCRKIHADAVVDSFLMVILSPINLIRRLFAKDEKTPVENMQVN